MIQTNKGFYLAQTVKRLPTVWETWVRCLGRTRLSDFRKVKVKSLSACATLCDPMDQSLQGSSFPGMFQASVLEWVAISFSRGSS